MAIASLVLGCVVGLLSFALLIIRCVKDKQESTPKVPSIYRIIYIGSLSLAIVIQIIAEFTTKWLYCVSIPLFIFTFVFIVSNSAHFSKKNQKNNKE